MLKILLPLLFFTSALSASLPVVVSVAPTKFLVERIGQDKVSCSVLVPSGASPHSYEPAIRQIVDVGMAKAWFRVGENFENRILTVLKNKLLVVDLHKNLDLLPSNCCAHHQGIDTHIWFSPRLLRIQAEEIKKSLAQLSPSDAAFFQTEYEKLDRELEALDRDIKTRLSALTNRSFLVAHPAFRYFCLEYGLEELSIEIEGKEPTTKQLYLLLEEAKEKKIDRVFVFPQYSTKGAELIAKEIGAKLLSFDPYAENILKNLEQLSHLLMQ